MSAILREALEQDDTDEPKTLLEIGVAVKRPISTRPTLVAPTPISHSQHLLHHLTSAPAPPATSSSHLQHHLSSQFTPIHHHRPSIYSTTVHPWNDAIEMVAPPAYPLHAYQPHNLAISSISNASNGQSSSGDGCRYGPSSGLAEHKITRTANTSWKDRAIQIERGEFIFRGDRLLKAF